MNRGFVVRNWQRICVACSSALMLACGAPKEAVPSSQLSVWDAWARAADSGANAAVYFTLGNAGAVADTLKGVASEAAELTPGLGQDVFLFEGKTRSTVIYVSSHGEHAENHRLTGVDVLERGHRLVAHLAEYHALDQPQREIGRAHV